MLIAGHSRLQKRKLKPAEEHYSIFWFNYMEENKIITRILGIRPSRKRMGIAIVTAGDLQDWRVMGFPNLDVDELCRAVEKRMCALIQRYKPNMIAIEEPSPMRLASSPTLGPIVACIQRVARASCIRFCAFDTASINHVCGDVRATRQHLVARVLERFPHLKRSISLDTKWQKTRWIPMFVAIAVALTCEIQ